MWTKVTPPKKTTLHLVACVHNVQCTGRTFVNIYFACSASQVLQSGHQLLHCDYELDLSNHCHHHYLLTHHPSSPLESAHKLHSSAFIMTSHQRTNHINLITSYTWWQVLRNSNSNLCMRECKNISPPLSILRGDLKAVVKNTDMFWAAPRHVYFELQCPLAVVSSVPRSF